MFQDDTPPPKNPMGVHSFVFFCPNTSISVSGRSSPPPPLTLIKKILVRSLHGEMFVSSGDRRSIHFTNG